MEMKEDISNIYDEITRQASEHINEKDIIMTYGQSDLLCSFLKSAFTGGDMSDDDESQGGVKN
jgi:translation initiation factor 2B subunit (eIF-2B alpha/beta/delta family)